MDVSLIIPYRDRAAFLPRTLQSVSLQQYEDIEVILVDNGSQDNSASIVEGWAHKERERGRCIHCIAAPTGGACAARNAGLRLAQGTFVYFFDSDDEMSANFLTEAMRVSADCDIVAAQTVMCFPNGREKKRRVYRNASVADQILTGMLSTQSMLLRRSFLVAHGGWDDTLYKWNDWELGTRLLCHNPRVHWLKEAFHRIHQHPDSLTGSSLAATIDRIIPSLRAVEALPLDEQAKKALAAKKVILASTLPKDDETAKRLRKEATTTYPHLRLLYAYARLHLPGAWWLYRSLSPLF